MKAVPAHLGGLQGNTSVDIVCILVIRVSLLQVSQPTGCLSVMDIFFRDVASIFVVPTTQTESSLFSLADRFTSVSEVAFTRLKFLTYQINNLNSCSASSVQHQITTFLMLIHRCTWAAQL